MNELRALSGATWQEILKLLGTGDFLRITFRPPTADERYLGRVNGMKNEFGWWICEAEYADMEAEPEGGVISYQPVTRKIVFRLHDYDEVV